MSGVVTAGILPAVTAVAYGLLVPCLTRPRRRAPGRSSWPRPLTRAAAGCAAGFAVLVTAAALGILRPPTTPPDGTDLALAATGIALGCGEFAAAAFAASVAADTVDALRGTRLATLAGRLCAGATTPRTTERRPAGAAAARSPERRPASAVGRTHWLGLARGAAAEEARASVRSLPRWGACLLVAVAVCDELSFRAALVPALAGAGAVTAVAVSAAAHTAVRVYEAPAGRRRVPETWVPAVLVPAVHAVLFWRTGSVAPLLTADVAYLALLIPTERSRRP
ncbi:CPBP family glutamic-type intramembrane protease [Streptomyces sp. CSDS2]|uniref:CPBP family glutamic-type intramembrane protease n=1 Tax=Streptomyces sp. CSDS2 TaxID=3055051 RepID=UPI0025AF9C0B|nr:CPBP family glutamic-type intramembrane protease [Streptomyces sp. CSDS2]MDN3265598.1 CPBP family glutamic-type intramembrane protease [Streptomyces sp. CSDS2]